MSEMKAVKPKEIGEDELYTTFYSCPKCGGDRITVSSNYCPGCGAKLCWPEEAKMKKVKR